MIHRHHIGLEYSNQISTVITTELSRWLELAPIRGPYYRHASQDALNSYFAHASPPGRKRGDLCSNGNLSPPDNLPLAARFARSLEAKAFFAGHLLWQSRWFPSSIKWVQFKRTAPIFCSFCYPHFQIRAVPPRWLVGTTSRSPDIAPVSLSKLNRWAMITKSKNHFLHLEFSITHRPLSCRHKYKMRHKKWDRFFHPQAKSFLAVSLMAYAGR